MPEGTGLGVPGIGGRGYGRADDKQIDRSINKTAAGVKDDSPRGRGITCESTHIRTSSSRPVSGRCAQASTGGVKSFYESCRLRARRLIWVITSVFASAYAFMSAQARFVSRRLVCS